MHHRARTRWRGQFDVPGQFVFSILQGASTRLRCTHLLGAVGGSDKSQRLALPGPGESFALE
jgi:hypothetical protein